MTQPLRPSRIADLLILAGCLLVAPHDARAASEIIATRLLPSSVSARYGNAIPVSVVPPGGTYLVGTRTGVEFRGSSASSDTLFGSFRTAGIIREVAWSGRTAYLVAGERGIVAVDASDSTNLVAIGSHDHLGDVVHGAFARSSGVLAAATNDRVFFLRETSPGALDLIDTRAYQDGRRIVRVQARSDSFLVLGLREAPTLRMFLTLYRAQPGAAPESLWEFQVNGFQAQDLTWPDAMAFIAVGNGGVLPFNTVTRLPGTASLVASGRFVRRVDADAGSVVAIGEARTYARFARGGANGGTLGSETSRVTDLEPFEVSLVGGLAVISEDDQLPPVEPEEVSRSLLEVLDVAQPALPSRTTTTGTGRARRVIWDEGLAYVADYSGGLRIYRAGSADTSLVGAFPLAGNSRAYDVALDRVRRLAYVASGTGGLAILNVAIPASPALEGTLSFPGGTVGVSVLRSNLVAVARRGGSSSGVTFVDVADSTAPAARGSLNYPFVQGGRALAFRDTVLFVADELLGVLSVGFGNPDAPVLIGAPSGTGASDLDLSGTRLIVGTSGDGVQVVDATNPVSLMLLATVASPPTFGVAQLGETAIVLLGDGGALAVDLRFPSAPLVRGVIQVPGFARDATWIGDTLLIAESFGLERFRATATVVSDPSLGLAVDPASALPRVAITWTVAAPVGAIGWNLYRDSGGAAEGLVGAAGVRVNDSLLDPAVRSALDRSVQAATTYRYRLEAFFPDGSSRKAAEGAIYVGANSTLGRVYPNPYRPRNGQVLNIPYRVLPVDGGKSIELRVYDPSGRLVRRITAITAASGGFASMTWDGRDERGRLLADGVYFVQLNGPGIDDARQLILLR
jgi:hypothetical protein